MTGETMFFTLIGDTLKIVKLKKLCHLIKIGTIVRQFNMILLAGNI